MPTDDDLDREDQLAKSQQQLAESQAVIENLNRALVNARVIGAAVGIVMTQQKLTYDDAFEALAQESQTRNVKLRILADNVLLTGLL